jgi:hypothetical protein
VPALVQLLPDKELSHMARYALERIEATAAADAMRNALPKLDAALKVGVIGSLGVRRDVESVPVLASLASDSDPAVAQAATLALGAIRTRAAADALAATKPNGADAERANIDASLACAEEVLSSGDTVAAKSVYQRFVGAQQPKHVRLAATRGLLACAGKK